MYNMSIVVLSYYNLIIRKFLQPYIVAIFNGVLASNWLNRSFNNASECNTYSDLIFAIYCHNIF